MRTIVVGVDGSRESIAALRYALHEAHLHGDRVKAVAAWHVPTAAYGSGFVPSAPDPADFERVAGDSLETAIAATAAEREGVPLETVLREGEAAHVLLEESEGAAQLVVGSRNLGFVSRLVHHSVSGQCSHDAHCPVTVVHGGEETETPKTHIA